MSALLQYTKEEASPEIFRLWAAIHGVGAAGARRVWTEIGNNYIYPNLYVWLVSPPGIGKTMAITPMAQFLRKAKACYLAPNDLSKAGLLDALSGAGKVMKIGDNIIDYFYMGIYIAELSNFMPRYDPSLAGLLTDLYDCPDLNEEGKRHGLGKTIPFPGLSMLAGTATGNLGATVPHEAWNTGFMARVIMVYSNQEIIPPNMFAKRPLNEELAASITAGLKKVGEFKGEMVWTPEAQEAMQDFRENHHQTAPTHSRLAHYCTRRWFHAIKLCMVAALSEERMEVRACDFHTALRWLLHAEDLMPKVFKEMIQHEDGALLEELRQHLVQKHKKAKGPIEAHEVYFFLSQTAAAHRATALIELAISADYIRRVAGTSGIDAQYVPVMEKPG